MNKWGRLFVRFKLKAKRGIDLIRDGQDDGHVKQRILVPFTLVLMFVIAAFLGAAYLFQNSSQQEALEQNASEVEQLLRLQTEKDAGMMHAAIEALTNDPVLREAMRRGDKNTLLERVRPLYEHLRTEGHITHIYFTRSDRMNLLRVHEPERSGDIIDRVTMIEAAANGKEAYGIELGVLGTLTLRTVLPWRDPSGELLGFVEMGKDISEMAEEMHRILGVDLLLLVPKSLLDQPHWNEGQRMLGHDGKWDQFPTSVAVAQTMTPIPQGIIALASEDSHTHKAVISTEAGRKVLYAAFLPLTDVAERQIGDIVVIRDVTAIQQSFRHSMALIAALSILAGVVVFFLFLAVLTGVENTYRKKREIEHQFLLLTSEHERIIQIEKLSEVGKTIGEIAHQLNNPLVGVINLAQLAERSIDDPERTLSLLNDIRQAGEDCRGFVRRMLEFTKISRSERHPTDMRGLARETLSLFQQSFAHRRVETEFPPDPVVLDVDPILIRHALFNLLSNAAQVSPPDSLITISLTQEILGEFDGWTLAVIDEGTGISPEVMDKIFVPFFSTRPEGTGLGLPVVQHIAILHGGRVAAVNRPKGGAAFSIWLPSRPDEDEMPQEANP